MGYSAHVTRYRVFHGELSNLLDLVLAGDIVADQITAERLVRAMGTLVHLQEQHCIDKRGRCAVCWTVPCRWWRPWPKRSTCTVHEVFNFFFRQPTEKILAAIED